MPLSLNRIRCLPEDARAGTPIGDARKKADIGTMSPPKLGALTSISNLTKRGSL
jgi:hypothetical protein